MTTNGQKLISLLDDLISNIERDLGGDAMLLEDIVKKVSASHVEFPVGIRLYVYARLCHDEYLAVLKEDV